jgi:hypothetical protein
LVAVERADHAFFLTHADQVWPKVESFLKAHTSRAQSVDPEPNRR